MLPAYITHADCARHEMGPHHPECPERLGAINALRILGRAREKGAIVSFSFGLPALFLLGGLARNERTQKLLLEHGDVLVWGGPARLRFHGVQAIQPGCHDLVGECRLNLTFRRAAP